MAEHTGGAGDGSDPIQQMVTGAHMIRSLFNAYVLVGFNEAQSIYGSCDVVVGG